MSLTLDTARAATPDANALFAPGDLPDQAKFADAPLKADGSASVDLPDRAAADGSVGINGSDAGTRNPDKQTVDGKTVRDATLHEGKQADITREQTLAEAGPFQTYVSSDQVVITTKGGGDDNVQISQRDDGTLDVSVNDEKYEVRLTQDQELTIRTGAGNDTITAAPNVTVNLVVDSGAGKDTITTGMGNDRIDAGDGDDVINTIGGRNDIFGGKGNDTITATGTGASIINGGDGDDVIQGGDGFNFLEGGKGNDQITGGAGHNIVSGGLGDDVLTAGSGTNNVYAGQGADTIKSAKGGDTVYAEKGDSVEGQREGFVGRLLDSIGAATGTKATVVNVEIDPTVGTQGITVNGSDSFVQRVESELEFLRSSPNGQQMLAEFDKAAAAKGNTVTIQELANEQNGYAQTFSNDADIRNGKAGAGGDVTVSYNPSFHMDAFPAPTVVLYHELSHAYNGVTGTFQPGTYQGTGPDSGRVPNAERQAVGLETSAKPFDFDGDPSTPPTTANPDHLTENGIREELGMPDRPSYAL